MTTLIEFDVPGTVTPWARAGAKGKIRFTPRKQADYMGILRMFAARAMNGRQPIEGPVMIDLTAVYPWPATMSKKKRNQPASKWRTAKPDADNVLKIIGDSLTGIAWKDDAQVVCATVKKMYGDAPKLLVHLEELGDN